MGKYALRGGRSVVAMFIGPVLMSNVICSMSVSKLSVILFMFDFANIALPSYSSLFVLIVCVV